MKAGIAVIVAVALGITTSIQAADIPKKGKSVVVYLPSQQEICYQNGEEVFRTRCSTGRTWGHKGKTKYRQIYHVIGKDSRGAKSRSRKLRKDGSVEYDVSTPWKVMLCNETGHLVRNHEYHSVPSAPASHGCIRVPKGKGKWIYQWVEVGTPYYFVLERAPKKGVSKPIESLSPPVKIEPKIYPPIEPEVSPPEGGFFQPEKTTPLGCRKW